MSVNLKNILSEITEEQLDELMNIIYPNRILKNILDAIMIILNESPNWKEEKLTIKDHRFLPILKAVVPERLTF